MGSRGSSNPWPPYSSYRDCSLGICSIYCPQWCYIVFPPPPPSDSGGSSHTYLSPLVIAVIGILASAFLLVTYYVLATKYCRRRRRHGHRDRITGDARISTANEASRQNNGGRASGLDELIVSSISVYKYRRGEGLVDGTDCSVCLSEFEENESLRLLPKCNHAFHLPCIDTWFKSHSSCPLCRSNVALAVAALPPAQPSPPAAPHQVRPAAVHGMNSHAYSHVTDAPDDRRILVRDEAVISLFCDSGSVSTSKDPSLGNLEGARRSARPGRGAPPEVMRRSVSLNTWLCGHGGASTSSDQNPIANGNVPLSIGIGSSGPSGSESDVAIGSTNNFPSASPPEMRRSISAGRFPLGSCGPGRTWATPCPVENREN